MMTIHTQGLRRDTLDGTATIKDLSRIHGDVWQVTLAWPGGNVTKALATRKHACIPMDTGVRVRVELIRIDSCALYVLT